MLSLVPDNSSSDRYAQAVAAGCEKHCAGCDTYKPITEFGRSPKGSFGANSTCKACVRAAAARRAAAAGRWPMKRKKRRGKQAKAAVQSLTSYISELVAIHRGSPATMVWHAPADAPATDTRRAA